MNMSRCVNAMISVVITHPSLINSSIILPCHLCPCNNQANKTHNQSTAANSQTKINDDFVHTHSLMFDNVQHTLQHIAKQCVVLVEILTRYWCDIFLDLVHKLHYLWVNNEFIQQFFMIPLLFSWKRWAKWLNDFKQHVLSSLNKCFNRCCRCIHCL